MERLKILHITPHLGGGVGTVIMDWTAKASKASGDHVVLCLDYANEKAKGWSGRTGIPLGWNYNTHFYVQDTSPYLSHFNIADVVLVHYWDYPMLKALLSHPLPPCRLVFWCHKNVKYSREELAFPDLWVDTSPIQGHGKYIWSTGDMERFLKIKKKEHEGFNIGTVCSPKLRPDFLQLCFAIKKAIPEARFIVIGEWEGSQYEIMFQTIPPSDSAFTFTGKVDDVIPYLAEMDVFGYPLRPGHYGTCEQALGEAMAAGVVPVTMDNKAERMITLELETDAIGYVETITALYEYPDLRATFSALVRERAKELYNIDNMISQWNETFESMMQMPKKERKPL